VSIKPYVGVSLQNKEDPTQELVVIGHSAKITRSNENHNMLEKRETL